jgi:hypothetical protein
VIEEIITGNVSPHMKFAVSEEVSLNLVAEKLKELVRLRNTGSKWDEYIHTAPSG